MDVVADAETLVAAEVKAEVVVDKVVNPEAAATKIMMEKSISANILLN